MNKSLVKGISKTIFVLVNIVALFLFISLNVSEVKAQEKVQNIDVNDLNDLNDLNDDDFDFVDDVKDVSPSETLLSEDNSDKIAYLEFQNGHKVGVSNTLDHDTLLHNAGFMNPGILTKENNKPTNTAIAAHNMKNGMLFGNLKNVDIGENVKLVTKNNVYTFQVVDIKVVDPYAVDMIEDDVAGEVDILSLMTCTNGGKDRLFVIGQLIDIK